MTESMGVSTLPKTVTRQRRECDLNPGPAAPESSTLTTRLASHPNRSKQLYCRIRTAAEKKDGECIKYNHAQTQYVQLPQRLRYHASSQYRDRPISNDVGVALRQY